MSASVDLALAAIDPAAAISASDAGAPMLEVEDTAALAPVAVPPADRRPGLTLAVTVDPPPPHRRWRFFVFWCLLWLAARIYPFHFEIYRTPQPWEIDN